MLGLIHILNFPFVFYDEGKKKKKKTGPKQSNQVILIHPLPQISVIFIFLVLYSPVSVTCISPYPALLLPLSQVSMAPDQSRAKWPPVSVLV